MLKDFALVDGTHPHNERVFKYVTQVKDSNG
jgi:hypothetical protein